MITAKEARKNVELYEKSAKGINEIMDALYRDIIYASTHGFYECFRTIQCDNPELRKYISIYLKSSLNELDFNVLIDSVVESSFRVKVSWFKRGE